MIIAQMKRFFSIILFVACAQAAELPLAEFKDFDDLGQVNSASIPPASATNLQNMNPVDFAKEMEIFLAGIKAEIIANNQRLREQHFKALPCDVATLVEEAQKAVDTLSGKLNVKNTIQALVSAITKEELANELKQALERLEIALQDGSFIGAFFTSISNDQAEKQKNVQEGHWDLTEAKALAQLLSQVKGDNAESLTTVLEQLAAVDYRAAARTCYAVNADAVDTTEAILGRVSKILMQLSAKGACENLAQRDALVYWTKQVNKNLHTVVNIKKMARKANVDLSWFLYAMSQLYDLMDPYFMVHGQWNLRTVHRNAGFSGVLLQDLCFRSGIALTAMAQHHLQAAGSDLTQLIMQDGQYAQFIDPLGEGMGILAMDGMLGTLKKSGMQFLTGIRAFGQPAMYASQLPPLAKFGIRFTCAFAWYNLDSIETWVMKREFNNEALRKELYRAILRMGIFELQGFVTGKISQAIYKYVGAERTYAIENATMGIVSPALLAEFMDVCISWSLMQRHPVVENYVAQFNDIDIHAYNNRWYLFRMQDAYDKQYNGNGPGLAAYMKTNERAFLEYKALYYVFGVVGRHWARKGASAYIEQLSAGVTKVGMKLASYCCDEDQLFLLKHSREFFIDFLQGVVQDVMHTAGSPQRTAAIDFAKAHGMIPADIQDAQLINDYLMQFFIDYFYAMGLFDYQQVTDCLAEYVKHAQNLEPYVPYLVDKVWHAILIYASGAAGRFVGYKIAELFFRGPAPVPNYTAPVAENHGAVIATA